MRVAARIIALLLVSTAAWAQAPCTENSPSGQYNCNTFASADQTATPGNRLLIIENSSAAVPQTQCTATESGVASKDCLTIQDSDNTTSENWQIIYNTNKLSLGPTTLTIDADNAGSEPANGAGIFIEGGSGNDATLLYNSTTDQMYFNYALSAPSFAVQAATGTAFTGGLTFGSITIDGTNNTFELMKWNPTVKYEQDGLNGVPSRGLFLAPTIGNDNDEASPDFGQYIAIDEAAGHGYDTTAGNATLAEHVTLRGRPGFTRSAGTGTDVITAITGFQWVPTINSNVTATTVRGVWIKTPAGSGTETTNIGVDIDDLGGSTQIGLRNADTTVFTPPTTQSLAADTDTITCSATFKVISATATRNLTSDPNIADGQTGQICILKATGANTITIEDQGTDALSGVQLVNTAFGMTADDILVLMYDGTDWLEVARAVN